MHLKTSFACDLCIDESVLGCVVSWSPQMPTWTKTMPKLACSLPQPWAPAPWWPPCTASTTSSTPNSSTCTPSSTMTQVHSLWFTGSCKDRIRSQRERDFSARPFLKILICRQLQSGKATKATVSWREADGWENRNFSESRAEAEDRNRNAVFTTDTGWGRKRRVSTPFLFTWVTLCRVTSGKLLFNITNKWCHVTASTGETTCGLRCVSKKRYWFFRIHRLLC